MSTIKLTVLSNTYSIHRLSPAKHIPQIPATTEFYSLTLNKDEISIVCESQIPVKADKTENDWKCLKIIGPLDFSLTGILAKISNCLAQNKISIFAVSTFDTDYILVKNTKLQTTLEVLKTNDYLIV